MDDNPDAVEYAPCPSCRQYSHSLGDDALAAAFNHFQSMIGHPMRGHPMGDAFDEATRDAAQVLMAAATRATIPEDAETARAQALEDAACLAEDQFFAPAIAAAIRALKDRQHG